LNLRYLVEVNVALLGEDTAGVEEVLEVGLKFVAEQAAADAQVGVGAIHDYAVLFDSLGNQPFHFLHSIFVDKLLLGVFETHQVAEVFFGYLTDSLVYFQDSQLV